MLCIKKVALFQHEQSLYYPFSLAVVPSSVRYLRCFLPLSVFHNPPLSSQAKVSKEDQFFSPLSPGLQSTFLSQILVQCCAFER